MSLRTTLYADLARQYFYADFKDIYIATINEGGGRNQIKTYGEWLLQRPLKKVDPKENKNPDPSPGAPGATNS